MQRGGASVAVEKIEQASSAKIFSGTARRWGRCACGYLGSVSVRSTDLDFSFKKNLNSYPALQATERGSSRGKLSPLTVFWFLLYAQKERLRGERCLLCLCKRLHDADRREEIWYKGGRGARVRDYIFPRGNPAGRRKKLAPQGFDNLRNVH